MHEDRIQRKIYTLGQDTDEERHEDGIQRRTDNFKVK